MDQNKNVDLANEPVDLDDEGIVDTGVLHEFPEETKTEEEDAK